MSQGGRGHGKTNRIAGTRMDAGNGDNITGVPEDLVWDEDNHPVIFMCSNHTSHHPMCDKINCEGVELDSALQVALQNEARAFMRAGMSFMGVPAAYEGVLPVPGIKVELLDLLMWLEVLKKIVTEVTGISEFDFQEKFRVEKLEILRGVREFNEDIIRKQRVANSLGVVEKPLYGPDGQPFR